MGGTTSTITTGSAATISTVLNGTNSVTKSGAAVLTLGGTNAFSGGLVIQQGRVNVTGIPALGSGAIAANSSYGSSYASGGNPFLAVTATGGVNVPNAIVLPNPGSTSYYAIQKSGTGSSIELGGLISGGGPNMIFQLDSPTAGDSTTAYTLSGSNTFAGVLRLNRGRVSLSNANAAGTAALLLDTNTNSAGNLIFTGSFTFPNRITIATSGNAISTGANDILLSGILTSAVPWSKTGTGKLTLTGANAITGTTTINAGTLAGTSSFGGATTVSAGAVIAPGIGGIGTITVNSTLSLAGTAEMEVSKSGATLASDKVVGISTLTCGGVLTISKVGPTALAVGDSFQLFSATSYGGGFSSINLPPLPLNLSWNTNSLMVNGSISVQDSGWTAGDIGTTGVAGSTQLSSGTYTINGAGADIWGTADAFHYASTSMTGDGEIRARVTSQTNTGVWAKAGVMMRDTTAAGSSHAMMVVSPSNGFANQYRATTGGSSAHIAGPALNAYPNNWVRVTRCGSLFTTYVSANGTAWTQVGQETVTMGSTIRVGLAVDSLSSTVASTATFDNVAITPYPSPWLTADIGTTGLAGRSEFYNSVHTLNGAGVVAGTADGFRFTYQSLSADGDITVRVPSFANTGTSSRIGVMIRDTLSADSRHVFIGTDGSGAFTWTRRTVVAGSTTTSNSGTATAPNVWIRLVRTGNDIAAYSSVNGTSWTAVGTVTVAMASNCYIGLATSSGSTTTSNASTFDNIAVTP